MLGLGIGLGLGIRLGIRLGSRLGLGIGLGMGLGIGLGSGFEYFRQYNVIRRNGIRRNGAEPRLLRFLLFIQPLSLKFLKAFSVVLINH